MSSAVFEFVEQDTRQVVVEMRGVSKHFGGTTALDDVDITVYAGEIHAIIGENGAGKSTLMKCLAGAYSPDRGTVSLHGKEVHLSSPADAISAGIRVVWQELALFGPLTVAENLTSETVSRSWWRSERHEIGRAQKILDDVGLDIDPRSLISELSISDQQLVEIVRALASGGSIVVLDEPTSALSPPEADVLFAMVRRLAAGGTSFILVTHFLEEVLDHADRVTVLRNGCRVRTADVADVNKHQLVQDITGGRDDVMSETYEGVAIALAPESSEPIVVEVSGLTAPPLVRGIDLHVRRGEVLGIYGDLGAGHSNVAEILFGTQSAASGTIAVNGRPTRFKSPADAREHGIAFIPPDRRNGLAEDKSVSNNITMASLRAVSSYGFIRGDREASLTIAEIERLRIKTTGPDALLSSMSGGNQQKVMFARWMITEPKVLIAVEPTRGMDIGAKSDVLQIIAQLASEGVAVIVVSAEPETVLAASHRVLVVRRGRVTAHFAGCSVSKNQLLEAAH